MFISPSLSYPLLLVGGLRDGHASRFVTPIIGGLRDPVLRATHKKVSTPSGVPWSGALDFEPGGGGHGFTWFRRAGSFTQFSGCSAPRVCSQARGRLRVCVKKQETREKYDENQAHAPTEETETNRTRANQDSKRNRRQRKGRTPRPTTPHTLCGARP